MFLTGCASSVKHSPTELTPLPSATSSFLTLARATEIHFDTGYKRTLQAGSQWQHAGTVVQGEVYRPNNSVFTVEGAHIHEAWLIIKGGVLTGFYLPVERSFTSLSQPVPLSISSTTRQKEQ